MWLTWVNMAGGDIKVVKCMGLEKKIQSSVKHSRHKKFYSLTSYKIR